MINSTRHPSVHRFEWWRISAQCNLSLKLPNLKYAPGKRKWQALHKWHFNETVIERPWFLQWQYCPNVQYFARSESVLIRIVLKHIEQSPSWEASGCSACLNPRAVIYFPMPSILMVPSHLLIGFHVIFSHQALHLKSCSAFLVCPMPSTCSVHLIPLILLF
jgi:hypothetical protein